MSFEPQNSQQIIQLLQDMETYSRTHAAPLPMEDSAKSLWSGIGFRVADHKFVVPMEFVREIMKYPVTSQVPGSKEWVRGIANIRGNLLPVFDLQGFLGKKLTPIRRETRILSIARDKLSAGLIVDEIYGMKYFDQSAYKADMGHDVKWKNYFSGGYELDGDSWVVFNMKQLVESRDFLNVAS